MSNINAEFELTWGKILAESWKDKNFRERVKANPGEVLSEKGFNIPENIVVSVVPIKNRLDNKTILLLPFPEASKEVMNMNDKIINTLEESREFVNLAASSSSSSAISCCCP
jgi:hypothetical protein